MPLIQWRSGPTPVTISELADRGHRGEARDAVADQLAALEQRARRSARRRRRPRARACRCAASRRRRGRACAALTAADRRPSYFGRRGCGARGRGRRPDQRRRGRPAAGSPRGRPAPSAASDDQRGDEAAAVGALRGAPGENRGRRTKANPPRSAPRRPASRARRGGPRRRARRRTASRRRSTAIASEHGGAIVPRRPGAPANAPTAPARGRLPDRLRGRNPSAPQATEALSRGRARSRGRRAGSDRSRRPARVTPTPRRPRSGSTRPARPAPGRRSTGDAEADLAIVGGGFSGLWAALQAKERRPRPRRGPARGRPDRVGPRAAATAASSSSSLTHGIGNGLARFPEEMPTRSSASGSRTSRRPRETLERHGIDCDLEQRRRARRRASSRTRSAWLARGGRALRALRPRRRAPRPRRGPGRGRLADLPRRRLATARGAALVDPAQALLGPAARGRASSASGSTRARRSTALATTAAGRRARDADGGAVRARRRRCSRRAPSRRCCGAIRRYVVPVYDYVLVTEPLSAGAARRDRLARTARASATAPTSSTTTG